MNLPSSVLLGAESALEAFSGRPTRIVSSQHAAGGCINPSAKLIADTGDHFFLKWNPASAPEMFEAEADGLLALAGPGFLRIPAVLGTGGSGTATDPAWLLLEFIPQGRPAPDYGFRLGEGLAALHGSVLGPDEVDAPQGRAPATISTFGWHRDNFIGSLPQLNEPVPEWPTFWRDQRLEPQLRLARKRGHFTGASSGIMDRLLDRLADLLEGAAREGPVLLHGDLWSGNYYPDPAGEPVLIDPAVYRGAGEVDLAMMELFGSFPEGFTDGYRGRRDMDPDYGAFRRDLYQLYYLLVHVNLFGGSYVIGSLDAARRVLREV